QRHAAMLAKYDTNKNGKIDPEEREAIKADRQARRAELLKKYDTDGDGTLSPAEREAMRKDLRAQHGGGADTKSLSPTPPYLRTHAPRPPPAGFFIPAEGAPRLSTDRDGSAGTTNACWESAGGRRNGDRPEPRR